MGPTIKKPYVELVLNEISHLNSDLIAITGDLVDGSVSHLRSDCEPLAEMIAPYGTFFATGNHEYYSGVDQWLDETDRLGIKNARFVLCGLCGMRQAFFNVQSLRSWAQKAPVCFVGMPQARFCVQICCFWAC